MKANTFAALLLAAALTLSGAAPSPEPARDLACTVIGEDLTNAQTREAYAFFGIERGSVRELPMTNAEERDALEGLVDASLLGRSALSCVYLYLISPGETMEVEVRNMRGCSGEAYRSALLTAGITDVKVFVTAPEEVPGAAALAGIYKAYETLTGAPLSEDAKSMGARELATTEDLAGQVGAESAASIVGEIKGILADSGELTDEQLRARIRETAADHSVTLNDYQVDQLLKLCRGIEGLGDLELMERLRDWKQTAEKLSEYGEKAEEAKETAVTVLGKLRDFLDRAWDFLSGLLD